MNDFAGAGMAQLQGYVAFGTDVGTDNGTEKEGKECSGSSRKFGERRERQNKSLMSVRLELGETSGLTTAPSVLFLDKES